MRSLLSFLVPLLTLVSLSSARVHRAPAHHVRQLATTASAPSSVAATASTTVTVSGSVLPTNATSNSTILPTFAFTLQSTNPTAVPLSSIVAGATSAPTSPLSAIPAPGSVPTYLPGAPPLPDPNTLRPADYPPLDKVPPIDSPQVQQWIADVKNSGVAIPGFSPNVLGGCSANPQAASDPNRCWWYCGGCTRKTDITDCPTHMEWGLTYDDGPAYHTTQLLSYLDQVQLKSTFFVVGSRVISFPSILQAEYLDQHQIAVHTWSHSYLTTLTNEQIIAELGWSKKVIKDVLGVTPNIMRPPYGDIDDRVRAISIAMGLTPVIWTRISPTATFDTGDFNINGGLVSVSGVLYNWENIISNATARDRGFIVLEHDLFQQTVEIATGYILPDAIAHNFVIKPVVSCLGLTYQDAYIELNDNKTNPPLIEVSGAVSLTATPSGGLIQSTGTSGNSASKKSASNGLALAVATAFGGLVAGSMIIF
ncbi:carbohydrate esterase family 4 protein [Amanita muscaria Koide BX008]|uniref:chitin deacetylase n=1 Tax=Amanita muscaria (strain Koide BX008) TaxID=946122 RepID=A0A0C2XP84_AMAMK|nr:carbohydrate esterase family 4 protein [Amanita muscaria Koide BX008]